MKNHWIYRVSIVIALFLLGAEACGTGTVRLTSQDAGTTLHLRTGQGVEIALDGNPTTGYTWEVAPESDAPLRQNGQPEFKANSNALGAGGTMTLRFTAQAQGSGTLKLIYHRPFEPNVAPLKTFEVKVVVE